MKKLRDYEEEDQNRITRDIRSGIVGLPTDWDGDVIDPIVIKKYGVCDNCEKVIISKTKYGRIHAYCEQWEKFLNEVDPVVDCTKYRKRGQMALHQMQNMATIIEIDTKKIGLI